MKKYLTIAARLLMGLGFFIFGLNGFLQFIPQPTAPMSEAMTAFTTGLMKSGYMFPLISGTELVVGALLLLNIFVPLALILIAPILVNIIAIHLFMAPESIGPGLVFVALELYLVWSYRASFCGVLKCKNIPNESYCCDNNENNTCKKEN